MNIIIFAKVDNPPVSEPFPYIYVKFSQQTTISSSARKSRRARVKVYMLWGPGNCPSKASASTAVWSSPALGGEVRPSRPCITPGRHNGCKREEGTVVSRSGKGFVSHTQWSRSLQWRSTALLCIALVCDIWAVQSVE